jgi:hypothetical protein
MVLRTKVRAPVLAGILLAFNLSAAPGPNPNQPGPMPQRQPLNRPNLPPVLRNGVRTNAPQWVPPKAAGKTNAAAAKAVSKGGTNAPAASTGGGLAGTFRRWQTQPLFYPVVIGMGICVLALVLMRVLRVRPGAAAKAPSATPASKLAAKGPKAGTISSCNVLDASPQGQQIWQFDTRGGRYVLGREHKAAAGASLPSRLVGKDWRALFQRKLNIAWLPPEQVFLRVVQLPRSNFDEMLAMVELQLEKLSPMPVAQTVWSFQVLPHSQDNLQTVVVMVVARSVVEEFLGKLEGNGFLADRLELPVLDQLQATVPETDGAWVYPEAAGGKNSALVAWWYGRVLRNVDFLTLPPAGPNRAASLKEQLMQMAWAGEMDGWLTSQPQWHLVAGGPSSGEWETALHEALEQKIELIAPLPPRELAGLTARRAAAAEPRSNLMPAEFAERYRQQFVDRLWMKGLLAVGGIYLAIVAVYMIGLGYASWRTDGVEGQVAALSSDYTNALQLKAKYQVLKDRQDLKYAALECWNVTASLLPEGVTLDTMNFSDGKRFTLNGTAPSGQLKKLLDFEGTMRKATVDGQLLFDPNKGEGVQWRDQGAQGAAWSLALELQRSEAQ